jgi:hypothetical protein
MGSATTIKTHQFKEQKTIPCWVPNTQQSVAAVTSGWWDTSSEDPRQFQHWNQTYAFATWLGWCQTLDICQMGWFLQKGRAKVTPLCGYEFLSHPVDTGKRQSQHMTSFLDNVYIRAEIVLSFRTNKNKIDDVNHLASDQHHQVCKKSVSQGCTNTQDTVYEAQS